MNAPARNVRCSGTIAFSLNGSRRRCRTGETIIEAADRTASRFRGSATSPAIGPTATAARAWSRSRASACWRRRAAAQPTAGMEVSSDSARAVHSQKMIVELLASDMPERSYKPDSELDYWQRALEHRQAALRAVARSRRPTSRIRRWPSISTRASSARAACARAARSR